MKGHDSKDSPSLLAIIARCEKHAAGEVWIVCTHVELITRARLLLRSESETIEPGWVAVTGDALCPVCEALVEADRSTEAPLRIACGACVRERWSLLGAS